MNIFGFILGREAELSKAEIFSVLERINADYKIVLNTKNILIIKTNTSQININELGGTIKLFSVLGQNINKDELRNFIQNNVEIGQAEKRINFGISGYGNIQSNQLYAVGKKIKDHFIQEGFKARFVTGKFKDLSSVIVTENKLIERGFEAIVVENLGKYFIGQTIAVQNYKAYSKRDYGRTARDDKSGMLPPKLAQILINLSSISKEKVIYDPFCGSGTVLQEAILLGYRNIYGSDISEKAVEDTKENTKWLISSQVKSVNDETLKTIEKNIFVSNVLNPTKDVIADAIVGEGYLGEPVRRNMSQAKNDAAKLADFYLKALTNLGRLLKKNGRIVVAIPYFIIGKEKVFLPIENKLNLTDLNQVELKNVAISKRKTLLYARPDSFVGREIIILEK